DCDEREQEREPSGYPCREQCEPRAARDHELAKHARRDVVGPGIRADDDRRDAAEEDEQGHAVPEVRDAAGRPVMVRVRRVEDGEDPVRDDHRQHGERGDGPEETAALPQLEQLGACEAERPNVQSCCLSRRHSTSSSLDVIARKRSSRDACTGSSLRTGIPASTSLRFSSGITSRSVSAARRTPSSAATSMTPGAPLRSSSALVSPSTPISTRGWPSDWSSANGPVATISPRSTIAMSSHVFSTSSRMCDDSITVRPSPTSA